MLISTAACYNNGASHELSASSIPGAAVAETQSSYPPDEEPVFQSGTLKLERVNNKTTLLVREESSPNSDSNYVVLKLNHPMSRFTEKRVSQEGLTISAYSMKKNKY